MQNAPHAPDLQRSDEEIINNLELLINLDVLEESDLWGDLAGLVIPESPVSKDGPDILESEK